MKVSRFGQYLQKLEKTASRNKITAILASLFKEAKKEEIDQIVYLSLGRLKPSFSGIEFNLAEKMMIKIIALAFTQPEKKVRKYFQQSGDLGQTAFFFKKEKGGAFPALTVSQVYKQLYQIAQEQGLGSQERKCKLMAQLIEQVPLGFVKYLVRIPIGRLRLGFSEKTILDALSWMAGGDKQLRPEIESAFSVAADAGMIAKVFKAKGLAGLKKINSQPGVPILTARAERLPSADKIIEKLGKCALEPKIDGFRVQIHLDRQLAKENSFVKIFSRNLEDTTEMFPDLVEAGQQLLSQKRDLKNCILDGEAVGMNPKTKKPFSFQKTAQRKRKYELKKAILEVPLTVFVFDLLFYNNRSLLKKSFWERRKLLSQLINFPNQTLKLTPQKIISKKEELIKEFDSVVAQGWEGLMCKKLDSIYQSGARNYNWVKFKKTMSAKLVDTIDCLVLGYYWGKGKRTPFGIGAFLVGVFDQKEQKFPTIAKIGTGLTDKQWVALRKKCDRVKTKQKPKEYLVNKNLNPNVWCLPEIVVEIEADEITKSPIHTAAQGLALRFPRLKRFREKNPVDITTINEVLKLHQNKK